MNRDFPTFSRICIFFLLTLSLLIFLFSLPLPCSAFHLSVLSEVWLLNFLRLVYLWFIPASTLFLHFVSGHSSIEAPLSGFVCWCGQDISALGLRHVGYAIPTELFAPFVSSAVVTVREQTSDDVAESAFRWSLKLGAWNTCSHVCDSRCKVRSANQQVRLEKTTYSRGMQSLYLWSALISRDVTSLCIGCSRCSAHQSRFAKDISFQDFGPHNFGREHNCNLDRVELEEWEAKRLWGPLWPHAPLNLTNNLLMSMAVSEQWQRNGEI